MTRRRVSLLLDSVMLVIFVALMSWRLTGVPAHEWAAIGLIGLLVVHLLLHWHWIETRVARVARGTTWRTRLNVLLNASLFVAMAVAMVSGVVISKVVAPNALSAPRYLAWHSLHDGSSTAALVILGLHVALNWDRIASGMRRALSRASQPALPTPTTARRRYLLRPLAWIVAAAIVVTVGTRAAGALLPANHRVLIVRPNGRVELSEPPPEITGLLPGSNRPSLSFGTAGFVARIVVLAGVAVIGRRVLKLRLS